MVDDSVLKFILIGIVGMLLLAIALIVFFVIYQRRLLAQRETINRQQQEHQRQLLASTLKAQEAERRRIAQDLHDSVGSQLSAAKLYVGQLPSDGPGQVPRIKTEARDLIDTTIGTVRSISQNLLPPNLENFGLVAAIEDLCHLIRQADTQQVDFQHDTPGRLDPQVEVALFRITQELTNNTLKHAEASKIDIQLHISDANILSLTYRDNGKGFEKPSQNGTLRRSLGLDGIESRAQLIGATWSLVTAPGQGVSVRVELPVQERENKETNEHSQHPEKNS